MDTSIRTRVPRPPLRQALGIFLAAAVLAAAALPTGGSFLGAEEAGAPTAESLATGPALTGGLQQAAGRDGMTLWVSPETGEFEVRLPDGTAWSSNPADRADDKKARDIWKTNLQSQFIVEYVNLEGRIRDTVNSFVGSVRKDGLTVLPVENGFLSVYEFAKEKFMVPLQVTLEAGFLRVRARMDLARGDGEAYYFGGLQLLPFFGAGTESETGYLVVPDGSGALIRLNNGKTQAGPWFGRVYGDDPSLQPIQRFTQPRSVPLPVYGIKREDRALLAVLTDGAARATLNAFVSGMRTSYNFVYPTYLFRASESFFITDRTGKLREYPILDRPGLRGAAVTLDFHFLSGEEADYNGMAARYRTLLPLQADAAGALLSGTDTTPSLYLDLYGAVERTRPVLGIPTTVAEPLTTFGEAAAIVGELRDAGVSDLVLRILNGLERDVRNLPTDRFTPLRSLGGVGGVLDLRETVGETALYLAAEPTLVRRNGWFVRTLSTTTKTLMGLPAYQVPYDMASGFKDGRRLYLLSPKPVADSLLALSRSGQSARQQAGRRLSVETLASTVYSDFGRKASSREETMATYLGALAGMAENGTRLMLSGANAYAVPLAERLVDVPSGTAGFVLTDAEIPFVQLVLSGRVSYAGTPINQTSNPRRSFLKAVESGSALHYAFIARSPDLLRETELQFLYGANYDLWKADVAADYARVLQLAEATGGSRLVGHEVEGPGIRIASFENGTRVLVNLDERDHAVDGVRVPAMDFVILPAEGGSGT